MTTAVKILESLQTSQQKTQQLLDQLSISSASRLDLLRRLTPWAAVAVVELAMAIQAQPWWRGDVGNTLNNIEATYFTWAGSDAIYSNPMRVGDKVAGYTITSAFGPRQRPLKPDGTLGSQDHKAVDLGTPVGVQIHMIGTGVGTVECLSDPEGWGSYAGITPSDIPYTFQAAHLQHCRSGQFRSGEVIGTTGTSGGVAPHLDWGQYRGGTAVEPGEGFLWWAIQGKPPSSNTGMIKPGVYGGHSFNTEQARGASELIATAQQIGVTAERDLVALLMAAKQESSLRNLKWGDRDSLGYLQQRPSQGWDPSTVRSQVKGFFKGAGTNPGFWDLDRGGDLGATIQAVQMSAHPHEYSKWQGAAVEMVRSIQE